MIIIDEYSDVLGECWREKAEQSTKVFLRGYLDYLHSRDEKMILPISIERIATEYLNLGLDILPLKDRFPSVRLEPEDNFLGAIYWDPDSAEWTIFLDQNLEEGGHEGRINFTMAHELAHYIFDLTGEEKALRPESKDTTRARPHEPRIYCRTSDALTPIERRADYAAASLIAPASALRKRSRLCAMEQGFIDGMCIKRMDRRDWRLLADRLAGEFGMSWNAMKRRIYEVGLYSDYRNLWVA